MSEKEPTYDESQIGERLQALPGWFYEGGWIRRHYRGIAAVSGAFLVAVGVLLMTGLFTQFFGPLARFAPGL